MKNCLPPPHFASALIFLAVALPSARGAIDITDASSFYDAENWYVFRSNASPHYSTTASSVSFSNFDASNSYALAYFSRVSLAVGDTLSVSGTLNISSYDSSGTFSFGLFDSVENTESSMPANQNKAGITDYTGTMTGVLSTTSSLVYRPTGSNYGFLATNNSGSRVIYSYNEAVWSIESGVEFSFSMTLTKAETGLWVSVSLGGNTASDASGGTTFFVETTLSEFDVLGFRFSSSTGGTTTLTNLQISTTGTIAVPEPATLGLLAGTVALGVCASSRRRRRRSRK